MENNKQPMKNKTRLAGRSVRKARPDNITIINNYILLIYGDECGRLNKAKKKTKRKEKKRKKRRERKDEDIISGIMMHTTLYFYIILLLIKN